VATAQDLLQQLADRARQFDVALIDNRLPGGYSLDVIRRCAEMGWALQTRKVLMTADATPETLEAARQIGCEVVTKPTSAAYLRSLLGMAPVPPAQRVPAMLDPGPLTMLKRAGASAHELARLCEQFRHAIDAAVEQLAALAPMKGASSDAVAQAGQIVHRVLSSCLTIGATALADDFKAFQGHAGSERADAQLAELAERCAETHRAVESLLGELATT
jgi:CheY-like chemotaxis protein